MLLKRFKEYNHTLVTFLLFFISLITFHSNVFADPKKESAEQYRLQAYDQQQKGNYNAALSFYTKAEALGEMSPTLLNDMGVLYEQIGFMKKAEHHYLDSIKQDKNYLPAYMNLAYLYKNSGDMDKAAQYFQRRFELAGSEDSWANKAKDELLAIRPEYKNRIVSMETNRLNQELEDRIQKELSHRVNRSHQFYEKGAEFFDSGEYKKAIMEFNQALKVTPENSKVVQSRKKAIVALVRKRIKRRKDRAIEMINAGNYDSAQREIQKILTIIQNKPKLISN